MKPFLSFLKQKNAQSALIFFLLSLLSLLLLSQNALVQAAASWKQDEYSHGYLIPFVAFFIGWHKLAEDKPLPRPSWWGVGLLGASFCLMLLGELASFAAIMGYSFILSLVGLALSFFGKRTAFVLAPAFAFLFFAVPLPHIVFGNLSLQLQLVSSRLSAALLELMGISVFLEGNLIDLGGQQLQVAEACNGLRYLFPLMSFGFIVAVVFEGPLWRRLVLFLSSLPITVGMNSLRISLVGLTVDRWGIKMAEGTLHFFEGYVVFLLCLAVLFVEVRLLLLIKPYGKFRFDYFGFAHGALFSKPLSLTGSGRAALALCLSFALLFSLFGSEGRVDNVPSSPNLAAFPLVMGPWRGKESSLSQENLKVLKLSEYFLADYVADGAGEPVNFYVAYYDRQRMGANIHAPLNCISGGGWAVEKQDSVFLTGKGLNFEISRLVIRKDGAAAVVYYWYDQRGRILNNLFSTKLYLILDALALHRTDGALVRATSPVENGDFASANERLRKFFEEAYPVLRQKLPAR